MSTPFAAWRITRDLAEFALPRDPRSAAQARSCTREALRKWSVTGDDFTCTIELLVDELVVNAVTHGRGDVKLTLQRGPRGVTAGVWDSGPMTEGSRDDPEHGRGLGMVRVLAEAVAVEIIPGKQGKTVKFYLPFTAAGQVAA